MARALVVPEAWGKDLVLARLQEKPGQPVLSWLDELVGGDQRSRRALYSQILAWRAADPEFCRQYETLALPHGRLSRDREPGQENWRETFRDTYLETRDKIRAAEAIGLSWATVREKLRKGSPQFDAELSAMWEQVEATLAAAVEADFHHGRMLAREQGDARTLMWGALEFLDRRDRANWGKVQQLEHSGTVNHNHHHQVAMSVEISHRANSFMRDLQAALPTPREESQVIDVTPVRETVQA